MMRSLLDFSVKIIRQGGTDEVNQLHYKYIYTIIEGSFKTLKKISLRDENFDKIVLFEILGIHSTLCKNIPNFYINFINNSLLNYNHDSALELMEKIVLMSKNKNQNINDVSSLLNVSIINKLNLDISSESEE